MRITLDLNDNVLRSAEKLATEEGKTLTRIVEEALVARTTPEVTSGARFRLRLLTKKGTIVPATNLAHRDALYAQMEGRDCHMTMARS
jgi:hypothetical protein